MFIGSDILPTSAREVLQLPLEFVPQLILAIALVLIGWILGWLIERVFITLFSALSFIDESLKNVGLEDFTKRAGMQVNLGKFFGVIFKVFVIFVFLVAALDVLGLETVNTFLVDRVLGYIPNIISAAIVIIIGLVVANFTSRFIVTTTSAMKLQGAIAARVTKWAILVVTILVALAELGIATAIVESTILGIIASVSLALGLAFGLGGQKAASEFIEKIHKDVSKDL